MIELNQSWAGPYHAQAICQPKATSPTLTVDPYPPDVLAACPQAREWGVVLVTDRPEPLPFIWMCGEAWWSYTEKKWLRDYGGGVRRTREEALRHAPAVPPPGYVAAKDDFQKALDRVDARAEKVVANIPLSQRAIISQTETKPSLLDELAEVAYDEWFNALGEDATAWKRVALAVARRLLEREASEAEVDAGVRHWNNSRREEIARILKASRRAQLAELEGK